MAAAAGTLAAGAPAGCPVPAEMTAAVANMLEAALAAGLAPFPDPAGTAPLPG